MLIPILETLSSKCNHIEGFNFTHRFLFSLEEDFASEDSFKSNPFSLDSSIVYHLTKNITFSHHKGKAYHSVWSLSNAKTMPSIVDKNKQLPLS